MSNSGQRVDTLTGFDSQCGITGSKISHKGYTVVAVNKRQHVNSTSVTGSWQ